MAVQKILVAWALCAGVAAGARGQAREDTTGLDRALQRYASLVMRMSSDSIGAMYLPTGVLAAPGRAPIVGPAAVAEFLKTFADYRVLAYAAHADSVMVKADTAWQLSRWWQRVRIPAGDTVMVSGGLAAEWVRVSRGEWRLRRLGTFPMDAGPMPVH